MENNDLTIIRIGGTPYTLKLTNGVLKRFCASHKLGINSLEQALDRYDMMLDLVYMMILREHPGMTQTEFDKLVDDVPIMTVVSACAAAFEAAFGNNNAEDREPDPTQTRETSTGMNS